MLAKTVAVQHGFHSFVKQRVAHVPTQRPSHIGSLVVRVFAIGMRLRDPAQRMVAFVRHVGGLEHRRMVGTDGGQRRGPVIMVLQEHVFAEYGHALVDPHVFRGFAGNQVAPPMVAQFVGHHGFVGQVAVHQVLW